MQWNWKRMVPGLATSLIAFTSLVNADTDSAQMRNLDNRVTALEQRRGASGMINPPGRPQVRNGADLFVFGQALYWKAHEDGTPYVVAQNGSSSNLSNARIYNVHPKWDWGFRVGAGYNLPHDGWDLSLTWLRFYTYGNKSQNPGSGTYLFTTRADPSDTTTGSPCLNANTHLRININQLDLDMGREFFVSKWLTVRPHFGLRSNWIRQNWRIYYNNFVSLVADPAATKLFTQDKDNWFGLGLEGGLDTDWGLGSGFSLFGNLTTAILYGVHNQLYVDSNNSAGTVDYVRQSFRVSTGVLDLMMGLRWDKMFSDDRFHISFEAGWEHHIYFNQNQFPVFTEASSFGTNVANQGDLTYQGWTFGGRFDF